MAARASTDRRGSAAAGAGALAGLAIALWIEQTCSAGSSTQMSIVFLDVRLDWRLLAFTIVARARHGFSPAWRRHACVARGSDRRDAGTRPRRPGNAAWVSPARSSSAGGAILAHARGRRGPVHADVQHVGHARYRFRSRSVLMVSLDTRQQRRTGAHAELFDRRDERGSPSARRGARGGAAIAAGRSRRPDFAVGRTRPHAQRSRAPRNRQPAARRVAYRAPITPDSSPPTARDPRRSRLRGAGRLGAQPVAIVNETFVRRYRSRLATIGQRFRAARSPATRLAQSVDGDRRRRRRRPYRRLRDELPPTFDARSRSGWRHRRANFRRACVSKCARRGDSSGAGRVVRPRCSRAAWPRPIGRIDPAIGAQMFTPLARQIDDTLGAGADPRDAVRILRWAPAAAFQD